MATVEESLTPVLEFDHATLMAEWPAYCTLRDVELRLMPGEWAAVRMDADDAPAPLAPAAQGMIESTTGRVRFEGHAWSDGDVALEAQLRSRIGRVFDGWGWVSNLTVLENVLLSLRHHTRRDESELEREADALAQQFGLPQVPRGRPANLAVDILRRSEWVRAFLAEPKLLLLEHPTRGAPHDSFAVLAEAVGQACRRGAAALWITADDRVWRQPQLRASRRYEVIDERLQPAREPAA